MRCSCSNNCWGVLTPGVGGGVVAGGGTSAAAEAGPPGFPAHSRLVRADLRRRRLCGTAGVRRRSENKFSRRAVVQVSDQDQVIGSPVEQVGDYISRWARAEAAKHPLVAAQPLNLHAAPGRDLAQNGGQAGVVGANGENVVTEIDLCFLRRLLQHRGRHRRGSLGRFLWCRRCGLRLRRSGWLSGRRRSLGLLVC